MSISVSNITLSIDSSQSKDFTIFLDGVMFRLENLSLHQSLLSYSRLGFTMHKEPQENVDEARFVTCGHIIGKEVTLSLQTLNVESTSILNAASQTVGEIAFKGVVASASGYRSGTEYFIHVEALSWEALLDDNPSCKSYENMTLESIISDVTGDYAGRLECQASPRFKETIPYSVQYNENNWQFLCRLARRYGEWLYSDGTKLVFGKMKDEAPVTLRYPSRDLPAYHVDLSMRHVDFSHVASSYNSYDSTKKEGIDEMQRHLNELNEQVFNASRECYSKATLQNLHSGGFADTDGRETVLNVSTKTQARAEKANMLFYSGTSYCSRLHIGARLQIVDNYISDGLLNTKSEVNQEEILITEIVHTFSSDETYSNTFHGIPAACDYPPYVNIEAYPVAPSCRAKVTDNEDPNQLGRIRVQFAWQAQLDSKMKTPWLRMAQPYAGGGKGFSFIPEIGEEVMVDFEGGNAERPYVKGTLYNGPENVDEAWVADSNSHNQVKAIRTRNGHTIEIHDEGSDGYIRIYDNEKENYILTFSTDQKLIKLESTGNIELYAQKDIIMHAGHNIEATADHDITETAKHDMTISVGNDMQTTVDNDKRTYVANDRAATIDHNDSLNVSENQFISIGDNKDEQVEHKIQVTAENIRVEAEDKLLQYSSTHQQKASDTMATNAGDRIDIKAGTVKVN